MRHGIIGGKRRYHKIPRLETTHVLVLNFSHPLTQESVSTLKSLLGKEITGVLQVKCQVDHSKSFIDQAAEIVKSIDWQPDSWQTTPFVVIPPGLSTLACCLIAEIHGRCGHFPTIVRQAPIPGTTPPQFGVAEIVSLSQAREEARMRR